MATESIQVSGVVRAPPDRIYEAWLDSAEHSAMTGGRATIDANVGGRFTAWDGYIEGSTLELEPGRRIVQRWRTSEFPPGAADSLVEIRLEPLEEGTRIIFLHSEIPEGQRAKYEQAWREQYLDPMDRYFASADEDEDDIEDDDDEDIEDVDDDEDIPGGTEVEEEVVIAVAAKPKAPAKPPVQKAAPAKAAPAKVAAKAPAKKAAAKRPAKAKKAAAKSTKKAAAKRAGKKASPKKKSAKKAKKKSARKASKKSARKGKSAKRSAKRGRR